MDDHNQNLNNLKKEVILSYIKEHYSNLSFTNEDEAFEWIKNNREKIKSKDKGEELSLSYIALILEVAEKLEKINAHGLQIKCAAYDNYLFNKETIDKLDFSNEDEAFEWIKNNREKIKSKDKGEE
ncbi:MAG: hypothetical protein QXY63_03655, partial [Candidatus Bilamarchaeaceae archaeon]